MFVSRVPRFTQSDLRSAVASARSFSDVLRSLGLRPAGGNFRTIRKYCELWDISTEHFDQAEVIREHLARRRLAATPLSEIMVGGSTYSRNHLKERLFAEELKVRSCEMCGQGEEWRWMRRYERELEADEADEAVGPLPSSVRPAQPEEHARELGWGSREAEVPGDLGEPERGVEVQ